MRLPEKVRTDLEAIRRLPIPLAGGGSRTGGSEAANARFIPCPRWPPSTQRLAPNQVSRENGKRRIVVSANVRGRDLGSFVSEAEKSLQQVKIPPGYWTVWGGQFENLQSATQRLQVVVPVSLLLVLRCCSQCLAMSKTACSCSPAFPSP